jgi:hypothetical protein
MTVSLPIVIAIYLDEKRELTPKQLISFADSFLLIRALPTSIPPASATHTR